MKLKHLQSALESVRVFDDPSIELEQYPTPPQLAAQIALAMHQHGDVEGKAIGGQLTLGTLVTHRTTLPTTFHGCRTHIALSLLAVLTDVRADLGVGCGILSIATQLLGSAHNVGFDIDETATQIARDNFAQLDCHVDIVHVDVRAMRYRQADDEQEEAAMEQMEQRGGQGSGRPVRGKAGRGRERGGRSRTSARTAANARAGGRKAAQRRETRHEEEDEESDTDSANDNSDGESVDSSPPHSSASTASPAHDTAASLPPCLLDTVVLNPPFGTRQSGVDVTFLHVALQLARTAVYSLHKSATRPYFVRLCERWGMAGEVIAAMRFDLKRSYAFHREAVREVEVDLWRFTFVEGRKPQRFCASHLNATQHEEHR